MGAPIGNQFWKLRTKHGKDKLFTSPELLWEACTEYFESVDNNPAYKNEGIKSGDMAGELIHIPTEKPYSMRGLCLYLGINEKYFNDFADGLKGKDDEISKDYSDVLTRIRDVVYIQKYNGAVVGNFNQRIIAVELGLTETINVNHTGESQSVNISIDGQKLDLTR